MRKEAKIHRGTVSGGSCANAAFRNAGPGPLRAWLWLLLGLCGNPAAPGAPGPLTTLEYRVLGSRLRVQPEVVTVPRNVPGSVLVEVVRGDGAVAESAAAGFQGGRLEATLRGPSFPAQRLVGEPGRPLMLPALRVAGEYQLDDVKWVQSGGTVVRATPASVPVKVFDEVLVSRVTSRPLSLEEIRDKGIVIDATNFRVVEFDVTLVLQGKSFAVRMPVVAPRARLATEIIPVAELEDRTVEAERINDELARSVVLPPEIQAAMPEFTLRPIHFEEVLEGEGEPKGGIPITGLLAIPGNIGFLNQFFSVQLFTENAAPSGSNLAVDQVRATIRLPVGKDGVPARAYDQPGDDPLRMARLGPDRLIQTNLPVMLAGADGRTGTEDDVSRLRPGETGAAEFLVEGLREGLHVLEMDLEAELHGLAAGVTRVRGRAVGSVLVRNANFSMTFSHPRTVRVGEPYEASVTLLNTGEVEANLTRVTLNRLSISGAVLLSEETVELGNLAPGESATATFRLRSQRTGSVIFSNLTTGDDAVAGRLNLTLGVDSRGVPLSPDTLVYPDWVQALPKEVFDAANRVMGQALGVATAGRLPARIRPLTRDVVTARGVELAEAGQRLRYGDDPRRVLFDLLLDWQGGRRVDPGFDQILRESDAGREWREAIVAALEGLDTEDAAARIAGLGPSLAGLGQAWHLATAPQSGFALSVQPVPDSVPTANATNDATGIAGAVLDRGLVYEGRRGAWYAGPAVADRELRWTATAAGGGGEIGFLAVRTNGTVERWQWTTGPVSVGDVFAFRPGVDAGLRRVQGTPAGPFEPRRSVFEEEAPRVLSARQDISILSDRAYLRCPIREYANWGTVLAVLFNKPMAPGDVETPGAYRLVGGDNGARTVKLQEGGRVCLLQLHRGVGSFAVRPRSYRLEVASLPDPRGHLSSPQDLDVLMADGQGTSVRGRVLGLDGNPVAGAPVTLTMSDRVGDRCLPAEYRAGQVFTDAAGYFALDFVLADVGFTIAAIDTSRMTDEDARTILGVLEEVVGGDPESRERIAGLLAGAQVREAMLRAFRAGEIGAAIAAAEGVDRATYSDYIGVGDGRMGSELAVVLRFRGRGTVEGRVLGANGAPLPGAAVNLFPALDSRELGRGVFADDEGGFRFTGVPLGEFGLEATTSDGRARRVSGRLAEPGSTATMEVRVPDVRERTGTVTGWVAEEGGAPHPGARVYLAEHIAGESAAGVAGSAEADADGAFRLTRIPVGNWQIVAVSADGTRKTEVRNLLVVDGTTVSLGLAFPPRAVVRGIVRRWDGTPAAGARVGGGDRVVTTDAQGRFELTGVPVGVGNILAGLDGPDTSDGVTRTATVQIVVKPGLNDLVELRLPARGRIRGVVYDGTGVTRVPRVRVAIPVTAGFLWVDANANGEYEFNGLGLGGYTISAPAPPVKKKADELAAEALEAIGSAAGGGDADAAAALVGELANLYAQGSMGRLTTTPFVPANWGFTSATLDFDGQTVVHDIRYLPSGRLSGTVVNPQGVPVGAQVSVSAVGPSKSGGAGVVELGPFLSDPSTGEWSASGFIVGPFTVTAKSPLLVGQAQVEGVLRADAPTRTNVVLRFPSQTDVTGRLTGLVLNPDGSPVTNGAVHISFTSDYVIGVDDQGRFDTQIRLPALDYSVLATNLVTGLVGASSVRIVGGITNFTTVRLLDRGAVRVRVLRADGRPATNAVVTLTRSSFPESTGEQAVTDDEGRATVEGLWQGEWMLRAEALEGATRATALDGVRVAPRDVVERTVTLGASGTISGVFLEEGTGRPIPGAQVFARSGSGNGVLIATAPTGADGNFAIPGVPLGSYHLTARNPTDGRVAVQTARLATANERVRVTLVEEPLGDVEGFVTAADGPGVSGVEVNYADGRGLTPPRTVTTGPAGDFRFQGVPRGEFALTATDPVAGGYASARGTFVAGESRVRVDLALPGWGTVEVRVLEPDGTTPAAGVPVRARGGREGMVTDTDAAGLATFERLDLGSILIETLPRGVGQGVNVAATNVTLRVAGEVVRTTVRLPGSGRVTGTVRSAGGALVGNALVVVESLDPGFGETTRRTLTEADGTFVLDAVRLGALTVRAVSGALAAFGGGTLAAPNATALVDLRLGGSGSVRGRIEDEDGNELRAVEVGFFFTAQNGQAGFVRALADGLGAFEAQGLPVATPIEVRIAVPALDGRRTVVARIAANGEVVDLGRLRLDQQAPRIRSTTPAAGAAGVEPRPRIILGFSEALRPESIRAAGIVLRGAGREEALDLALEDGPEGPATVLAALPRTNLASATSYTLVISGADDVDASGRPVSRGPEDLERRPLARTELLSFTVRDYLPPVTLLAFPGPEAAEVEPMAGLRWEFDEPIRTNRIDVALWAGTVRVDGAAGLNPNGRVLAWVPARPLLPDTAYRVELRGVEDLSGNVALPTTNRFSTLDTRGPRVAVLRLREGQRPVANATVMVEALLESSETDAVVRWSRNGTELGVATDGPVYSFAVRLPAEGSVRLLATGVDRAGNPGEAAVLELRVGPNERPVVELMRVEPPSGPLETGRRFGFAVLARDDATVAAVRVELRGAVTATRELFLPPNGVATNLVFDFPSAALAGGTVEVQATAYDDSGAASDLARLTYATRDATPPRMTPELPLDRAELDPREPLRVVATLSDNSRRLRWNVAATGTVIFERRFDFDVEPNVPRREELPISLADGLRGGNVVLNLTASDDAGNEVRTSRSYRLRSVVGPRLARIAAADLGYVWVAPHDEPISPWSTLYVDFDASLDARRCDTNLLEILSADGRSLPRRVTISGTSVAVQPTGPALPPGTEVRLRLLPGWVGLDGNAVNLADGAAWPAEGRSETFRVADVQGLSVANGVPAVPGQTLEIDVRHHSVFGGWQLAVNGVAANVYTFPADGTRFRVVVPTNAPSVRLLARSVRSGRTEFVLPEVALDLRSRDGDDDGDGLPNAWEADRSFVHGLRRFDPFLAADASEDFDFDRLPNRAEFLAGTDPFDSDTDGDRVVDGDEPGTGGCPSPLDPDSDDDGIPDGDDLAPCAAGEALVLAPASMTVGEGESVTNAVTATATGLTLVSLDFAPDLPRPAFVGFADFWHTGTNPIVRRVLLRPSFQDAGTHVVTFQVTARRAFSLITSNIAIPVVVEDRANSRFTRWARPVDGDWANRTNWTAGVPGIGTNAVIDLPGTYAVRLSGNVFVESLTVGGAGSGIQTLRLSGGSLGINGPSTVPATGLLLLEGGATLQGQGRLDVAGTLRLSTANVSGPGSVHVQPTGRLEVVGSALGGTARFEAPLINLGSVLISTNMTWLFGGPGFTNEAGGRVVQDRAQIRSQFGRPVLENRGEWVKRGTNEHPIVGFRFRQAGLLRAEQGPLTLQSGTVEFAPGSTNRGVGELALESVVGRIDAPLEFASGILLASTSVTNAVAQTWNQLRLASGELDGPGPVTVTKLLESEYGTLSGQGSLDIPAGAELRIPPFRQLVLERPTRVAGNAIFDTNATLRLQRATLLLSGRTELHGAVTLTGALPVDGAVIENTGTLVKLGEDRAFLWWLVLHNRGVVDVREGTLQIQSESTHDGELRVADGAALELASTILYAPGSFLGGPGEIRFDAGTHDLLGAFEPLGAWANRGAMVRVRRPLPPGGTVQSQGGQVILDVPHVLDALDVQSTEWVLRADLRVNRTLELGSSTFSGGGRLLLGTNLVGHIGGGGLQLGVDLTNEGRIEVDPFVFVTFDAARWINRGEVRFSGYTTLSGNSTTNLFLNEGTFVAGTNYVRFGGVAFAAHGRQELGATDIWFDGGTNATQLRVPSGGTAYFQNSFRHLPGSLLGGEGAIEFHSGEHVVDGAFTPEGTLVVSGGNVRVGQSLTNLGLTEIRAGTLELLRPSRLRDLRMTFGTLNAGDRVGIGRSFVWAGGDVAGAGPVTVDATATARASGFNGMRLAGTLDIAGTFAMTNSARLTFDDGTLRILSGGLLALDDTTYAWTSGGYGRLRNDGTLRKEGAEVADFDLESSGSGNWDILGGRLDLGGPVTLAGAWTVADGAEARFEGATNTIAADARFLGEGTLHWYRGDEILLLGPVDFGDLDVLFAASSLGIRGEFPIVSGPGGSLEWSGFRQDVEGSVRVRGRLEVGPNTVLRVDDTLFLEAGATLVNRGRLDGQSRSNIRVRAFPVLGGTVTGPPPDVIPPSTPLGVRPGPGSGVRALKPAAMPGPEAGSVDFPEFELEWSSAAGVRFRIEASTDLRDWQPVEADASETAVAGDGEGRTRVHRLRIRWPSGGAAFFRFRETDW